MYSARSLLSLVLFYSICITQYADDRFSDKIVYIDHVIRKCEPKYRIFKTYVSLFKVIRVKIRDSLVDDIEEIYMDDGQECSLSTVASYRNKTLVIGTGFKQTIVCNVKYLTK